MNIPAVVGLTGGIGSGKSTVCRRLEALGVPCLDADLAARAIHQNPAHPALAAIAQAFPQAITDGRLSRGSLRTLFAEPAANQQLRAILRPHLLADMRAWTARQYAPYVVWESALIVEAAIPVDRVLVVEAERATRIARVRRRNPEWSVAEIERVLVLQMDDADRAPHVHDTIRNDSTPDALKTQVDAFHRACLQRWE